MAAASSPICCRWSPPGHASCGPLAAPSVHPRPSIVKVDRRRRRRVVGRCRWPRPGRQPLHLVLASSSATGRANRSSSTLPPPHRRALAYGRCKLPELLQVVTTWSCIVRRACGPLAAPSVHPRPSIVKVDRRRWRRGDSEVSRQAHMRRAYRRAEPAPREKAKRRWPQILPATAVLMRTIRARQT
jgi:hypothetical protein